MPASLTTEPTAISRLITSLNFYLINENSYLIRSTIQNLDCSRTFYVYYNNNNNIDLMYIPP